MSNKEAVRRWRESAERNLETASGMVLSRHYDWALFVGQLALEKLLKGLIAQRTDESPPYIHDLVQLTRIAGLSVHEAQLDELATISRFNIEARYDSMKEALYKQATPEFTKEWLERIRALYVWIEKHF